MRPAAAPPTAHLEVVNRTHATRHVHVDDQRVGVVAAGARARFRHLPPRELRVSAEPARGELGDPIVATLKLKTGAVTEWELDGTLETPPPLAELAVTNTWPADVELRVDGRRVGTVLAGDTRLFRDLAAGERLLRATDAVGAMIEARVSLSGDSPNEWSVSVPSGTIEIVNDTSGWVALVCDGVEKARIGPSQTRVLDSVPAGDRQLLARDLATGTERRTTLLVDAATPTRWQLSADSAVVAVHNRRAEAAHISVSGRQGVVTVPAGEEHRIDDLPPGRLTLHAVGAETGAPSRQALEVGAGQVVVWDIPPVAGTVRIVNRTPHALVAYQAGIEVGPLPGQHELIVSLAGEPPFELAAVSRTGDMAFRKAIELTETSAATWEISSRDGALHVDNQRAEAVQLFVDSRPVGRVAARDATTFTGLGHGRRLVEAVGLESGAILRHETELPEGDELGRWTLADPRASLVVTNKTGERLAMGGDLGPQRPFLADGERGLFALHPGKRVVEVRGVSTGLAWTRGLTLEGGAVEEWVVEPGRGKLRITNELSETMVIELDGSVVGRIAAGRLLELDDVPAGQRELRAQGESSGRVRTAKRVVPADGASAWSLAGRPAQLLVANDSDEAVTVRIDGRPYGLAPARSLQGFGELAPGARVIEATGTRTGWRHRAELTLEDGATARLTVPAPRAVLVVDNESAQAVRVRVDGELVGEVEAGASAVQLASPAGRRKVTAESVDTGRVRTWNVELKVSHAVHVVVPRATARLVVANRSAEPLGVWIADRKLGELAPGEDAIFDELRPGAWRLIARGADGKVTHLERRVVAAGETTSWSLQTGQEPAPVAPGAP